MKVLPEQKIIMDDNGGHVLRTTLHEINPDFLDSSLSGFISEIAATQHLVSDASQIRIKSDHAVVNETLIIYHDRPATKEEVNLDRIQELREEIEQRERQILELLVVTPENHD